MQIFHPLNNTVEDSEFLIPQRKLDRVQNFWSPKEHSKGFRIYDPQRTLERAQNFWSPKEHGKGFRISDPPKNIKKGSEFQIPKEHYKGRSRISDPQRAQEMIQYFSITQYLRG